VSTNSCPTRYADEAVFLRGSLLSNKPIAADTWQARIECPELARRMVPGQFMMIRLEGRHDPLIGRAFAMYDRLDASDGQSLAVEIVYLVKGKFTQALAEAGEGTAVAVWGPLGNSFSTATVDHLIMVAGGVGQTPMLTLAEEALGRRRFGTSGRISAYARRVSLCYGARTASRLAGLDDFRRTGLELHLATDDGSWDGQPKQVTELLAALLDRRSPSESTRLACCGPEPMMAAVSRLAEQHGVACEVSLETPMACGIGICFSCVAKVKQADGGWDYQRTCVEGPIFEAARIAWE
jgi:dihydroorotate dehydrogenase electron transfer subunit